MRVSQWLLGGATTAAIAATIASGCGGSTNDNRATDSGAVGATDAAPEAAPEAAAEAGQDAPVEACTADADLTQLSEPDAEIGDTGATDVGCYTCIKTTCTSELTACSADCACNNAVIKYLTCMQTGGATITCGTGLATGGGASGLPLVLCVAGSAFPGGSGPGCLHACGVALPEAGATEAGPAEGGGGDAGPG
jgi:hypothetical protein